MIDDQELLFIVDEDNKPVKPSPRNLAHKNGLWHRTTAIWIINSKKQILCQKRSLKKDTHPGIWETCFGGHVAPNENYLHNATVEIEEELGIKIDENDLIPFKEFKSDKPTHKTFQQVLAVILNDRTSFKFDREEIDQICWKNLDEVKKILLNYQSPDWVKKPWDNKVIDWLNTLT